MGQYHIIVNFNKREYIHPHKLGCGLKLLDQVGVDHGTTAALLMLLACSNGRGGGDFRDNPEVFGRWAGDKIAVIGDYSEDGDIKGRKTAGLYIQAQRRWTDISDLVAPEIEWVFEGKFVGSGWRDFVRDQR